MNIEFTDKELVDLFNRVYSTEQLTLLRKGKITEEYVKENNLNIAISAALDYEHLSNEYIIKTYGIGMIISVLSAYRKVPKPNLIQEIAAQASKSQLDKLLELSIVKNNQELFNSINNIIKLNQL